MKNKLETIITSGIAGAVGGLVVAGGMALAKKQDCNSCKPDIAPRDFTEKDDCVIKEDDEYDDDIF